ncbi:hypothetical protein [Paenibacillus marinisediminis]
MKKHYAGVSHELYNRMCVGATAPKFLRYLVATYEPKNLVDDPTYRSYARHDLAFEVSEELDRKVIALMRKHDVKSISGFYRRLAYTYFMEQALES